MIRFFKKLFKRGDFMTRADKAYYKYRAKTIFWSAFCMIIIAWVGTNLVLCALTTNVTSNFDMIYEAMEPTVLPIGREVNKNIANLPTFKWAKDHDSPPWLYRYGIRSVTFDKYNAGGKYMVGDVDVVAACNTDSTRTSLNDDVTLYRMEYERDSSPYKDADVYILSNKKIQANPDSSFMFYCLERCTSFTFNNFDTSLVTNMMGMFAGDDDDGSLFSSKVKTIGTPSETQSLSNKNVHGLAILWPEYYAMSVTDLDLSSWDTSNVTNMYGMFLYCSDLKNLNVVGWNTSKVTDMGLMFYVNGDMESAALTTLDLSSFDTSAVENYQNMFGARADKLKTVYVSDRWNIPASVLPSGCSYVQKEYTGK